MFRRTSKERYYEALECLPPAHWDSNGFMVGEPTDHRECRITHVTRPTFAAFLKFDENYFESEESITYPEFKSYVANRLPC